MALCFKLLRATSTCPFTQAVATSWQVHIGTQQFMRNPGPSQIISVVTLFAVSTFPPSATLFRRDTTREPGVCGSRSILLRFSSKGSDRCGPKFRSSRGETIRPRRHPFLESVTWWWWSWWHQDGCTGDHSSATTFEDRNRTRQMELDSRFEITEELQKCSAKSLLPVRLNKWYKYFFGREK